MFVDFFLPVDYSVYKFSQLQLSVVATSQPPDPHNTGQWEEAGSISMDSGNLLLVFVAPADKVKGSFNDGSRLIKLSKWTLWQSISVIY